MPLANIEQYEFLSQTTLAGSINSIVTSITVTSAANLPAAPQFALLIDSEILLCTAISGTTLTVTRGAEGVRAPAAAHANGAAVTLILTPRSMLNNPLAMTAAGDIPYLGLTGLQTRLPIGTLGQALLVGGSGLPQWGSVPSLNVANNWGAVQTWPGTGNDPDGSAYGVRIGYGQIVGVVNGLGLYIDSSLVPTNAQNAQCIQAIGYVSGGSASAAIAIGALLLPGVSSGGDQCAAVWGQNNNNTPFGTGAAAGWGKAPGSQSGVTGTSGGAPIYVNSTAGTANVGVTGEANGHNFLNIGGAFRAKYNFAGATQQLVGVAGIAGGTNAAVLIGGCFFLNSSQTVAAPPGTIASAVVYADNRALSVPLALFRINGTTGLTVDSNANIVQASGKTLTLGNSAVTGLSAGALAAQTNASIVIKENGGQAYRIPCII